MFSRLSPMIQRFAPSLVKNGSHVSKVASESQGTNVQSILGSFSNNSFWTNDNMNFSSQTNLLKQFLDPEIVSLVKNAAGSFDFEQGNNSELVGDVVACDCAASAA